MVTVRRGDDACGFFENAGKVTGIIVTAQFPHIGNRKSAFFPFHQQLFGLLHTQMGQISAGGHANNGRESAADIVLLIAGLLQYGTHRQLRIVKGKGQLLHDSIHQRVDGCRDMLLFNHIHHQTVHPLQHRVILPALQIARKHHLHQLAQGSGPVIPKADGAGQRKRDGIGMKIDVLKSRLCLLGMWRIRRHDMYTTRKERGALAANIGNTLPLQIQHYLEKRMLMRAGMG